MATDKKKQPAPPPEYSSSDSDTDTDTDTSSGFIVKPIINTMQASTSGTVKKPVSKRPAPEPETKISEPTKRKKRKVASKTAASAAAATDIGGGGGDKNEEGKKSSGIQRVWSEGDVMTLLRGMIDYRKLKESLPSGDITAFYDSIKELLHFNFSMSQVKDKMKKLKQKYTNNSKKGGKIRRLGKKYLNNSQQGDDLVSGMNPEQAVFLMSRKVWDPEADSDDVAEAAAEAEAAATAVVGAVPTVSGKAKKKPATSGVKNSEGPTSRITLALPCGNNSALKGNGGMKVKSKAYVGSGSGSADVGEGTAAVGNSEAADVGKGKGKGTTAAVGNSEADVGKGKGTAAVGNKGTAAVDNKGTTAVGNGEGEERNVDFSYLNESVGVGRPEFGSGLLREGMSLIGRDKAEELKKGWKDLQREELKLYLKRIELVELQTKLALENLES